MSDAATSVGLPPGFRQEAETGMPVAGVVLLVVLLAAAAWAVWYARRGTARAAGPGGMTRHGPRPWEGLRGARSPHTRLQVLDSTALAAGARLQVVAWEGHRYLLATSAQGVPLLVDREPSPCAGQPSHDRATAAGQPAHGRGTATGQPAHDPGDAVAA